MTGESRSHDWAVFALVLSIAAHCALMWYMRPQVMATVAPEARRMRHRGPMEMSDRPEAPESVRLEVIKDLEALKESPVAESESLATSAALFDATEDLSGANAPEMNPAVLALPVPSAEDAAQLSERFTVEKAGDETLTPIAPTIAENMASAASLAKTSDIPNADVIEASPVDDTPDVSVPVFDAPDLPAMDEASAIAEVAEKAREEVLKDKKRDFIPTASVMDDVDVKVVEAEKAAVRDLLDVRNAKDLESFVKLGVSSAIDDNWLYFKVTVDPAEDLPTVPKDIVVLLDASGSIGKDRLASCRQAARTILRNCTNTGDRFNLVAFRDKFSYAFKSWQECNKDSFERADSWLGKLAAHGRTDVFATISSLLALPRDPARPLIAMVVTDGDANAGVSATAKILSKFTALNDGLVSVYMYGVKETANRELLDVLTHGNRGESFIYGGPRWNAGSGIERLAAHFRDPLLSDLRIVFPSDSNAQAYPSRLKNLYKGESVTLVGRAPKGSTAISFSIRGLNGNKPYEGFFTVDLSAATFDPTLPSVWLQEREIDAKLR